MLIQFLLTSVFIAVANLPTISTMLAGFGPPAIQYAKIEYTIHSRLHARCTTGFLWSSRVIQPYVRTPYQHCSNVHVIVFQEHNRARILFSKCHNVGYDLLAAIIQRMCFPGEDNLQLSTFKQRIYFRSVTENEIASLVRYSPPGKTD